jgi:hypothetical protein
MKTPSIILHEPLYDFFGFNSDGKAEFTFSDAVKIAGHACPTVAGAFLMTYQGLKALYGDETPVRGDIELLYLKSESEGVTGVIATVMGSIVGASGVGGFKGLGGQFARNNRVHFNQKITSNVAMRRIDTNKLVNIDYHPEIVSGDPRTSPLLSKILSEQATPNDMSEFQRCWNQRLEKILALGSQKSELIKIS